MSDDGGLRFSCGRIHPSHLTPPHPLPSIPPGLFRRLDHSTRRAPSQRSRAWPSFNIILAPALLHAFRDTFAIFQRGRGVLLRCYSASTPQALFKYASPPGSSKGCRYGSWFRTCLSQTGAKLSFRFKVLSKELWHVLSKLFNINRLGTLWENLVGPHGLASESSHRGCRMTAGCGSHVAAYIRRI